MWRDVLAVLCAAIVITLAMSYARMPKLRTAWRYPLSTTVYENRHHPREHERLPPPLVADLDGDGKNEVIFVTREPRIVILDTLYEGDAKSTRKVGAKYAANGAQILDGRNVLASASLLGATRSSQGRQAVALVSGFLDPLIQLSSRSNSLDRKDNASEMFANGLGSGSTRRRIRRRKQSIVVVLNSWVVLCFDHQLNLQWETAASHIGDILGIGMLVHHEVAAMVSSVALKGSDRGVVIVGGSMKLRDVASPGNFNLYNERIHEDSDGSDSSNFIEEKELQRRRDIYYEKLSQAEQFSYYAFDGRTGRLRWKSQIEKASENEDDDEEEEEEGKAGYAMMKKNAWSGSDTDTENSRTAPSELHWHQYRNLILAHSSLVLPHSWSSRTDTKLNLAKFHLNFSLRNRSRAESVDGVNTESALELEEWHHRPNVDQITVKAHYREQIPKGGSLLHAITPPKSLKHSLSKLSPTQIIRNHLTEPDVVVAHTRKGVDLLNIYTGKRVSQIALPAPRYGGMAGVWADINGDWIIDHLQAIPGIEDAEAFESHPHNHGASKILGLNHGRSDHYQLPSCWLQAVSGVPPMETIWNGPLCHLKDNLKQMDPNAQDSSAEQLSMSDAMDQTLTSSPPSKEAEDTVRVATPTLIRHPILRKSSESGVVAPFSAVALVSTGMLTHYNHKGSILWQRKTSATWHRPDARGMHDYLKGTERDPDAFVPGTVAADLFVDDHDRADSDFSSNEQEHILLVTGDSSVVLVGLDTGMVLSTLQLPDPPTCKPVVGDFTNDGTNDFIVMTRSAIVGYNVVASAVPNFLLICALLLVGSMGLLAFLKFVGLFDEIDDEYGYSYISGQGSSYSTSLHRDRPEHMKNHRKHFTSMQRRAMDFSAVMRGKSD